MDCEVRRSRRGDPASRWSARGLGLGVVLLLLTTNGAMAEPLRSAVPQPVELRVMTFNMWYGGIQVDFDSVVRAIRSAEADVVGLQEPWARHRKLARIFGWYVSPRLHVISRYPILEPEGTDGRWGFLLVGPGQVVGIANTHLSCCPYGPYRAVNHGGSRDSVLQLEANTRMRQLEPLLAGLAPLLADGVPTFFTGDFNSPSHRDWTREVLDARPELPYAVRWPATVAMEEAGFRDSYREVHPDPVESPGFTWTPGYPSPYVREAEVLDRIDYVWASGSAVAEDSRIVGEPGGPYTDVPIDPWPSDHRAVVSTFSVTPAAPPVFVAPDRLRMERGAQVEVFFHAPGQAGERVALFPAGSDQAVAQRSTGQGVTDGSVSFDTSVLDPGDYETVLLDAAGHELARAALLVAEPGQRPVLTAAKEVVGRGEPLEVSWSWGLGNRYDWLGVYRAGRSPKWHRLWEWRYVDAAFEGTMPIGPGARGPWPLPPGDYEVHYCLDDSYRCVASASFTVAEA